MADRNFGTNINLNQNSIKNVVIDLNSSDLASLIEGQVFSNSTVHRLKFYNGTAIKTIAFTDDNLTPAAHTHPISEITNLQTSLDAKQATITGAATTIANNDLTANRALISDASGKVAVSPITNTELSYLDDVTSNIQTQLNSTEKTTNKGAANGYCPLDASAKVPAANLPSYVDDVREFNLIGKWGTTAAKPSSGLTVGELYFCTSDNKLYTATGSSTWNAGSSTWGATDVYVDITNGLIHKATSTTAWDATTEPLLSDKIYVNTATNLTYRWSGSTLVSISQSIALTAVAPSSIGASNTVGTGTAAAREDHAHTIGAGIVTNAMQATMATKTIKANDTTGTSSPQDVTYNAVAASMAADNANVLAARKGYGCGVLTPSGGEITWNVATLARTEPNTGKYIADVKVYKASTWEQIDMGVYINQTNGAVTIKWNSATATAANDYYAFIVS